MSKRRTDLNTVYFPVSFKNLYFEENSLFDRGMVPVPQFRAVVNLANAQPLGVVSRDYRLVTNKEAVGLGEKAFKQLFNAEDLSELEVFNIIAPDNGSYCHIDLIHQSYEVNVFRSEVYVPYVRITNSYNKSRALRFDVGFVRRLCNNGVIFEKETISFSYPHTKRSVRSDIEFKIENDRLIRLSKTFTNYMLGLDRCYVEQRFALPMMCKALDLRFDIIAKDDRKREREREKLEKFVSSAEPLVERYFAELGHTAYAVFNAITDYSSHFHTGTQVIRTNALQTRAGKWVTEFAEHVQQDARLDDFLKVELEYFTSNREQKTL